MRRHDIRSHVRWELKTPDDRLGELARAIDPCRVFPSNYSVAGWTAKGRARTIDSANVCRNRILLGLWLVLTASCHDARENAPHASASASVPSPPASPEVREFSRPDQLSTEGLAKSSRPLELPDVVLTNEAGQSVRLRELVAGKIAVIQTIFTSCGTICPPMGLNFGKLQKLVEDQPDVVLISISIDPITDVPERLAAWADKFEAGESWTQLTGTSKDIRATLEALRMYTAEKTDHSAIVVVGHQDTGTWTRVDGLSDPETLARAVVDIRSTLPSAEPIQPNEIAHEYFTDVELVDQHGKTHRLYSDLLHGKVVVVNSFFTTCQGICPPMTQRIADLQALLGPRAGDDLLFLSLTVDPITDRTEQLAAYADKYEAGEGWLFLGGEVENVRLALYKFGFAVESPDAHSNLVIVGNEATGLWKKAFSMAEPAQLLEVVRSVIDDRAG